MIDIVMTYFNRKQQLIRTLNSIGSSSYKDFKVSIIDDASDEVERIENIGKDYEFLINVIRVEPKDKKWIEPLALINKTIKECQNEVVIFQCAECLHIGDVISAAVKNIAEKIFLAFACQRRVEGGIWWDVHSVMHPTAYPFCVAFMKKDYIAIGGFDEAFAYGFTCSDDELLDRVKRHSKIVFIDQPFVFHQDHASFGGNIINREELRERNQALLRERRGQGIQKWKKPW